MTKIFSIHDSKAEAYLAPFFEATAGTAVRRFETAINDETSPFNKYPGDYTLFEIGEWDEQTATLTNHKTDINLGSAIQYKKE